MHLELRPQRHDQSHHPYKNQIQLDTTKSRKFRHRKWLKESVSHQIPRNLLALRYNNRIFFHGSWTFFLPRVSSLSSWISNASSALCFLNFCSTYNKRKDKLKTVKKYWLCKQANENYCFLHNNCLQTTELARDWWIRANSAGNSNDDW